jgi:hypothetical protein
MTNTITYDIPEPGKVVIKVVDIIGTPVKIISNDHKIAGRYEINIDSDRLAPGKYYYKVVISKNGNAAGKNSHTKNDDELISSGQIKIAID